MTLSACPSSALTLTLTLIMTLTLTLVMTLTLTLTLTLNLIFLLPRWCYYHGVRGLQEFFLQHA